MKRETAIEWLFEQWPILESELPQYLIEQAKKIEQQQIINAHHDAYMDLGFEHSADDCAINYYRDTYEQNKQG